MGDSNDPVTTTVEVPAEHQTIVERFVALLKNGEQWVVDNVEGALAHFENLTKTEEDNAE
jgi:ABC-type nitrate/sulfonate/bicarbonate transport system substrate-binding protein